MRFRQIQALIFDFDGTLIDASEAVCHAFSRALEQQGRPPLESSAIRRLIGLPLRDMFMVTWPDVAPDELDRSVELYRAAFDPVACELSNPIPGLEAMLDHFYPAMRFGIATSRMSDGAQHILGNLNLLDRFEVIIGLQDVTQAKPHPEPVLKAIAALETDPRHAIMVGDNPVDMQSGSQAGTHTIGIVSEHYSAADLLDAGAIATISRLDELIEMVDHPRATTER